MLLLNFLNFLLAFSLNSPGKFMESMRYRIKIKLVSNEKRTEINQPINI